MSALILISFTNGFTRETAFNIVCEEIGNFETLGHVLFESIDKTSNGTKLFPLITEDEIATQLFVDLYQLDPSSVIVRDKTNRVDYPWVYFVDINSLTLNTTISVMHNFFGAFQGTLKEFGDFLKRDEPLR